MFLLVFSSLFLTEILYSEKFSLKMKKKKNFNKLNKKKKKEEKEDKIISLTIFSRYSPIYTLHFQ